MTDQPIEPGFMLAVEQMRQIAQEQAEATVRTALADVATRDEVGRMIEEAFTARIGEFSKVVHNADTYLRSAEKTFSEALTATQKAAGEARDAAVEAKRIVEGYSDVKTTVNTIATTTVPAIQAQVASTDNRVTKLTEDVFGNPHAPDAGSLVNTFKEGQAKADEKRATNHNELMNRLDSLFNKQKQVDDRFIPMESYIKRRQEMEGWIYNIFSFFAKHPRLTALIIIAVLGRFGIQLGQEAVTSIQNAIAGIQQNGL